MNGLIQVGMFGMPGHSEVIFIIIVIILLFGAKRLPELARSIGRSLTEFRKGREEGTADEIADRNEDRKPSDRDKG